MFNTLHTRAPKGKSANIPQADLMLAVKSKNHYGDLMFEDLIYFVHLGEEATEDYSLQKLFENYTVLKTPSAAGADASTVGFDIVIDRGEYVKPYEQRHRPFDTMVGPVCAWTGHVGLVRIRRENR